MADTTEEFFSGLYNNQIRDSLKQIMMTEEDLKNLGESINKIAKVGFSMPMSWEALAGSQRKGHYEPVGNKYTQWLAWWFGKQVFRFWQFTESRLRKFRHFEGVVGYDWEEAEYRPFKQKRRWVEDDSEN
jgi:hypothetical protein